jgi:hypothetical protein
MVTQGLVHLVSGVACESGDRSLTRGTVRDQARSAHGNGTWKGHEKASCSGEVVTTFENRAVRGEVVVSCGGQVQDVPRGTLRRVYKGCEWAWHNGTGYLLPDEPSGVMVTNSIDNATTGGGTTSDASQRVALFSLVWIFPFCFAHTSSFLQQECGMMLPPVVSNTIATGREGEQRSVLLAEH